MTAPDAVTPGSWVGFFHGTLDGVTVWGVLYLDGSTVVGDARVRPLARFTDVVGVPEDEVPPTVRHRLGPAYREAMAVALQERRAAARVEGQAVAAYLRRWAEGYRDYPAEDPASVRAHKIASSLLFQAAATEEGRGS